MLESESLSHVLRLASVYGCFLSSPARTRHRLASNAEHFIRDEFTSVQSCLVSCYCIPNTLRHLSDLSANS
jgi:hypothetical protein